MGYCLSRNETKANVRLSGDHEDLDNKISSF
jgi:hypothetical protein